MLKFVSLERFKRNDEIEHYRRLIIPDNNILKKERGEIPRIKI